MLRNSIVGGVSAATILLAVPALAADMPAPDYAAPAAPAPVVAPVAYDWTGVYAGVSAGYGWADRSFGADEEGDFFDAFDFDNDFEENGDGFLAGVQAGANWQVNQFVFGVEGDISWANIEGSDDVFFDGPAGPGDMQANAAYEMNWFSTVRGRIGVAFDRFLVYGTGGFAFADVDTAFNGGFDGDDDGVFDDAPFNNEDGGTHTGWTLGAGVEAALTDNLSLKAEYLYVDLGDEEHTYTTDEGSFTAESDLDAHVVRAGLNYRFNMF